MTRDEAAKLVRALVAGFPGAKLDQGNVDVYVDEFARLDKATGEVVLERAKDLAWWPSIGDLRKLMRESQVHADLGKLGEVITDECQGVSRLRGISVHRAMREHRAQCVENLETVFQSYLGDVDAARLHAEPWQNRLAALAQMGVR